jgi:hypothetical protein
MVRLAGTNVWYLTYQIRNDARFSYALSPNDRLISLIDPSRDKVHDLSAFERDPLTGC